MPLYENDDRTREDLEKIRKSSVCKECGGWLNMFLDSNKDSPMSGKVFVACADWTRSHHEGIEKKASQYKQEGIAGMNIISRRKEMEKQFGKETTTALEKYQGVTSLSKNDAMVILESIWPKAPGEEKVRAALLCASYHLNPLMKHVYLIPFNKGKDNESWATVMGIGATRLLASRKGSFSYVDDTPRIMTEEEQKKVFGESYPDRLYVIVKVKDPKTSAEAPGYGWWPKSAPAYGGDKGNTQFNMASNRAERQALSRLRPGEMPTDVEVMDEAIAESMSRNGNVIEGESRDIPEETSGADDLLPPPEATKSTPATVKEETSSIPPASVNRDESIISKEDAAKIMALAKQAGMTPTDLGRMMAKDLKWRVPSKIGELQKWQFDKLVEILNKAIGKP